MKPKPLRADAHILLEARELASDLEDEDLDCAGGAFTSISNVMKNRQQSAIAGDEAPSPRDPVLRKR